MSIAPIFGGFGSGGGGGGGGDDASLDFFAENGENIPIYGSQVGPAGFYDATGDETWLAWDVWLTDRWPATVVYNHTTEKFGPVVAAHPNPLNADHHGIPAIIMDDDGYVHMAFGCHNTSCEYSVTTSARDNTAWTEKSDIAGDYTYPAWAKVSGDLHFYARDSSGSPQSLVHRSITSISGGSGTVGSETEIANPGGTDNFYHGTILAVGSDVHIVAIIADATNSFRRHIYYLIHDTSSGSVFNHDKSVEVTSGSLPVTRTQLDNDFRIVDQGADDGNTPALAFDSSGRPHVAYIQGSGSSWNVRHTYKTSLGAASWESPTTVASITSDRFTDVALIPLSSDDMELWFHEDSGGSFTRGGDMKRAVRTSGTWGSAETIQAAGSFGIQNPAQIRDAQADARVLFSESADDDANNSADDGLRLWVHGASGYLKRTLADPNGLTTTVLGAFGTEPDDARKVRLDRLITDLYEPGIWSLLDALYVLVSHNATDALVNLIQPGTYDLTLHGTANPTFTEDEGYDTDGVDNYLSSNFNPSSAVGANFVRNSACLGVWSGTAAADDTPSAGFADGSNNGTLVHTKSLSDFAVARANSVSSGNAATTSNNPNGKQFYTANRSGSSNMQLYRKGEIIASNNSASSIDPLDGALIFGGKSPSAVRATRVRAGAIGGSLSAAQQRQLYIALAHFISPIVDGA